MDSVVVLATECWNEFAMRNSLHKLDIDKPEVEFETKLKFL